MLASDQISMDHLLVCCHTRIAIQLATLHSHNWETRDAQRWYTQVTGGLGSFFASLHSNVMLCDAALNSQGPLCPKSPKKSRKSLLRPRSPESRELVDKVPTSLRTCRDETLKIISDTLQHCGLEVQEDSYENRDCGHGSP